jgi:hypothetical protein
MVPNLNILCITYSKNLKEETREKAVKYNITNLEMHSFHSFAVQYYDQQAHNDIMRVKKRNISPKSKIPSYDLLIIDEIQDMTPDLYEFITHILDDIKPKQFLLIGDQYQCIYKFKNADNRYLIFGKKLFSKWDNATPWLELKLTVSYRVTNQVADFINKQLVGYDRVRAAKNGSKVQYIIMDPFKHMLDIANMVESYILKGYKPDDIFILSASVKSTNGTPLNILENNLVGYKKIPVCVQRSDDEKMDEMEMRGKVAFRTFHAVKGLERKICIVFGCDLSYFEYYAKDEPREICPATIYVACTRSIEHLLVVHDKKKDYLPFMNVDKLRKSENVEIINLCDVKVLDIKKRNRNQQVTVTDLVKYLPEKFVDNLMDMISFDVIVERANMIKTEIQVPMGNLVENVSTLYGTCIPLLKQMMSNINTALDIIKYIRDGMERFMYKRYIPRLNKIEEGILEGVWDYKEIMWMTNMFMMLQSGYINQVEQILHYDWVDERGIREGIERMSIWIDEGDIYEVPMMREMNGVDINGRVDMIDQERKILWEFKFVNDLTKEHILQTVVYTWIMGYDMSIWKVYLFNIKTGEIWDINKITDLDKIVGDLVHQKYYTRKEQIQDDKFIETSLQVERKERKKSAEKGKYGPIMCE